ncbi:hypothetical protein ACET97_21040 [Aeromonas enteropelogenes]|uniref:hypothetical protein n=1 Tax=Aeromonas enteropelogenes TaxID=29489 RepID=UPI0038D058A3
MNNKQTVSREEYRRLDNQVTCILQQRWPANEINQWVGMFKDKQQAIACVILSHRGSTVAQFIIPEDESFILVPSARDLRPNTRFAVGLEHSGKPAR